MKCLPNSHGRPILEVDHHAVQLIGAETCAAGELATRILAAPIAIGSRESAQVVSAGSLGLAAQQAQRAPFLGWADVKWDLFLIGGGIVLGTAANTMGLFVD